MVSAAVKRLGTPICLPASHSPRFLAGFVLLIATVVLLPSQVSAAPAGVAERRVSAERSGSIPSPGIHRLIFRADTGAVHVFTDGSSDVSYRVRVEAEAADPDASALLKEFSVTMRQTAKGIELSGRMARHEDADRVWVTYDLHVPRSFDMEASTQAGDIDTQDIEGRVALSTGGGTIRTGRIGTAAVTRSSDTIRDRFVAQLETGGGNIFTGDVFGALQASTAGGHIMTGNIAGDAVLHSDGGHIQVGRVSGVAKLSTGGGNILLEAAEGGLEADSGGGRIELGEAGGAIRAHTNGGGIRIARLAGPTDLNASDGGIFLTGVAAPLHAATAAGSITAWFSPNYQNGEPVGSSSGLRSRGRAEAARYLTATELNSRQGNIVVYLPRELPVTIDAVVEEGTGHQIVADPSLPLKVTYEPGADGRTVRGECALNGGGQVLRLKATAGDIELRVLDPDAAQHLATEQVGAVLRQMEEQRSVFFSNTNVRPAASVQDLPNDQPTDVSGSFSIWTRWLDQLWWGGLRVPSEDQQKRLIRSVAPVYPEVAQQAGIEGDVTLRLVIGPDGSVSDVRALSGEPVLARSAVDAAQQWRYAPITLNGQPIGVVTTVTLAFRLR